MAGSVLRRGSLLGLRLQLIYTQLLPELDPTAGFSITCPTLPNERKWPTLAWRDRLMSSTPFGHSQIRYSSGSFCRSNGQ